MLVLIVTTRTIVAVIVCTVGVAAMMSWLVYRLPTVDKSIHEGAPSTAPVTLCNLIANPDNFTTKIVHIRATLIGFHELALYDPTCQSEEKYIRADFDPAIRQKLLKAIAPLGDSVIQDGNIWADVILTGQLENLPGENGIGERKREATSG